MYHKVRIKKLPQAKTGQQVNGSLAITPTAMGGADINQYIGKPNMQVKDSLTRVPREEANLEAEGGETAYGDINGDGFTEHYKIKGPRHSEGGVPLDLPDGTFIFSDTKSMKIKDPNILKMFGKGGSKKSYTPAELAKGLDVNNYRKILQDPDSDNLSRKTAELMIRNYNMKLGALALAQESMKGFPQDIPEVSIPYMQAMGINPEDILPQKPQPPVSQGFAGNIPTQMPSGEPIAMSSEMMQQMPMAMYGIEMGGYGLPFAQQGAETFTPPQRDFYTGEFVNNPYTDKRSTTKVLNFNEDPNLYIEVPHPTIPGMTVKERKPEWQIAAEYAKKNNFITVETPSYQKGGSKLPPYSEKEAYTPTGVVRLNQYRSKYGLPPIGGKGITLTKADIDNAAAELQQSVIDQNPDLVLDYLQNVSHQPSNELKAILAEKDYPQTNEGIKQAIADGNLTPEEARLGYKDKLWWYRVLDTQSKELTKDEYEKKMKEPGAIKQGEFIYFHDDPDNPEMYTRYTMKEEKPAVTKEEITVTDEEPEAEEIDYTFPQEPFVEPDVPWSTQASRSFANALRGKYSREKQYPWAAKYMPQYPEPTYLDPTRAIAAQAEMANILTQGLGQFVGPQAASARAASIQGNLAKQAADTISNVYNQNVGIANQFGMNEAQIANQAQLQNQAIAKQLYDQTNYMKDQYRKEGLAWDQAMVDIANAADSDVQKLKMMNQLTPQYGVYGPNRELIFKQGKAPKPEKSTSVYDIADQLREYGLEPKDAIIQARLLAGQGSSSGNDIDAMMAMYMQRGGLIYGYNTFPFMI